MEAKFKKGDIVNLKSDKENRMTVSEVRNEPTNEKKFNGWYECMWFDITLELRQQDIREEVLEMSI